MKKEVDQCIKFAEDSFRLMYLIRYNIYPRCNNETVASHISQVSLLSLFLADRLKSKHKINELKVLKMAVTHDLAEINGMDIIHKVKASYPEIKKISDDIELNEVEKILGNDYRMLLDEFNNNFSIEANIVTIADIISCIIYAKNEIKLGNEYFNIVLKESNQRLKEELERFR